MDLFRPVSIESINKKGTSIRYALTHNPTIYDSLVKQFWQTATVRTLANGTKQLIASIDSKEYTINEVSVRSKLQLVDATGIHNLSVAEVYVGLATLGSYEAHLPEGNTSGSAEDSMQLKELMDIIPKVKILEKALKRKTWKVVISESEGEEPEDQGRIIQDIDDDPLVSLEEDISPTILEAAKTLSKVASQGVSKVKSTDKGKRYRRRARSVAKNINTGLDAEKEINTGRVEINTGIEDVNTGSTKVDSG
ncbi:hypothetical protein Tco_1527372, partial [Tanacetum coccineum]